jgi:PBP1b-binding outer membrane lipoprotein LpoB
MRQAIFAAAALLVGCASAHAAPNQARAEECRAKLVKMQQAGILKDLGVKPTGVQMVVDGPTWKAIDFGTKTGFVQSVVCLITEGDETKSARVEVRDHLENKVVGRYSGSRLEIP